MFQRTRIALCSVAIAMTIIAASPADAAGSFWQCAPFARMFSGIQLFGAAASWWNQAVGKYGRGETPKEGAVLVFKSVGSMRSGHVATVSQIVSDRIIKVTHANWSTPGRVENDVEVMDVSAKNDWSKVRVWFKNLGGLGTSSYPVYGFIYNGKGAKAATVTADAAPSTDVILRAAADAKASRARSPLAALVG